ncbi:MAG: heavy metal translocating P-type ATPase [Atopobiaceae bacterium]|jgi:Cd2+/Zn2+-exporting ATPase|nr:cadmium-translocating P-type ATPase [Atopobiaceae bacterium]
MEEDSKKDVVRMAVAALLFVVALAMPYESLFGYSAPVARLAAFLVPFLVAGYDVVLGAAANLVRGRVLDERFLMVVATIGAFCIGEYPEGVAVMLFYQVGEIFQDAAVDRSKRSIADMMDIAPEFANVVRDGRAQRVGPEDVAVGDVLLVKPGERVPLDGIVLEGASQLDTAALTGESVPRGVAVDDEVISGCVNMTGLLKVRVTKPYGESTVSRILDLVQNASEKKARTENFITRFAQVYTPVVVGAAALLAVVPPLVLGGGWSDWVLRGLTFLVVSCPCALVISVPLSFFGGIGGASRIGVLVKGSSYLELLSRAETVVFDKTGTLTNGSFNVVAVHPAAGVTADDLLSLAAHAEAYSDHPIALSIKQAYSGTIDQARIDKVQEESGHGVGAEVDRKMVFVGNDKLMREKGISFEGCELTGTILHVSRDGRYVGHVVIADVLKEGAPEAIAALKAAGVRRTVMLTGDRREVAQAVARQVGVDEYRAELLPEDKVDEVERLIAEKGDGGGQVVFVGDGINDAPVLMRSDIGIAMGAMGSDAAIEAADVVLMDDKLSKIAQAIGISRKTMGIVRQNIVFALAVKLAVLVLAALGLANMWAAVFADVGVSILATLNAMRCMRVARD